MSLREQFEAWFRKQHTVAPSTALIRSKLNQDEYACMSVQSEWQAYQAGHAVNADLLDALLHIKQAFCDSPAHGSLACEMASIATEAIKKARAE